MALPRLDRTKCSSDLGGLASELEGAALILGMLVSWLCWTVIGRASNGLLIAVKDMSCIVLNERGLLQLVIYTALMGRRSMKNADSTC